MVRQILKLGFLGIKYEPHISFKSAFTAGRTSVTLEHILVFATGADAVPPTGFNPLPVAQFWSDKRPRGNTCANSILLPTWPDSDDVTYEDFREFMDDGIQNSPGFGRA